MSPILFLFAPGSVSTSPSGQTGINAPTPCLRRFSHARLQKDRFLTDDLALRSYTAAPAAFMMSVTETVKHHHQHHQQQHYLHSSSRSRSSRSSRNISIGRSSRHLEALTA